MKNFIKKILTSITFIFFICALCLHETDTYAQASASITIKDSSDATAKKLDKQLKKGKKTTLKIKGSQKAADKTINSLRNRIKKTNGAGVVFQYTKGSTSGTYRTYDISADNAKLYGYSIKFINKLYKYTIKKIKSHEGYEAALADRAVCPDSDERFLRIVYDNIIKSFNTDYPDYKWVYDETLGKSVQISVKTKHGYDEPITVSEIYYIGHDAFEYCRNAVIVKEWTEDYIDYCQLKSFEEFKTSTNITKLKKLVGMNDLSDMDVLLLNNQFCDLSDAMKIYAIDASGYFDCRFKRGKEFGMVYSLNHRSYEFGSKAMKKLLKNKAIGVCATYAYYEKVVFEQLGIETYIATSQLINHGWTVVKVKNSAGKTLWIPFDYGIGPSPSLAVSKEQKKYINTEKKRYKLYLSTIKGAPKKKNFKDSDFK